MSDSKITWSVWETPNAWSRISEIAARIGVKPLEGGYSPTIIATGADGKQYDIWAVVAGVLDHMDKKI